MELLYRLFYTVFSMSCMVMVLLPVVLVLRFFFRRLSRSFTMALWTVLYLRAICPVGMSSPVCLVGSWNRRFHMLLRSVGLQISPNRGLLTSWRYVFQGEIEVSVPYMVCTVIWLAGIVVLLGGTAWRQHRLCQRLKAGSEHLYDNVYQTAQITAPLRTGILRRRIYLPEGLSAKEIKNIVFHQKMHLRRKDDLLLLLFFLITCIHWWNPILWLVYYLAGADAEFSCDEAVLRRLGWDQRSQYVQDIVNMQREEGKAALSPSLITCQEKGFSRRAEHLLYLESGAIWKKAMAAFAVTLLLFGSFGLSALCGGWGNGTDAGGMEEPLFDTHQEKGVTDVTIAFCDTQTASGQEVTLKLLITQGTYQKDAGYRGQCALQLTDEAGSALASLNLSRIFEQSEVQQFDENVKLAVADYNEDGTMEAAIGQQIQVKTSELTAAASGEAIAKEDEADTETTVYGYYLINIEDDKLSVISDPIYASNVTALQTGSMTFPYVEGAGGVIHTTLENTIAYYVWDADAGKYTRQDITEEEIAERQSRQEEKSPEGEKNRHTIKNSEGLEVIGVDTVVDHSGSQVIKKVEINPDGLDHRTGTKGLTNVEGYYCDLQWADTDGETDRYAVLIYNGTKGRTFVLYDVKTAKLFYRQEDGNQGLQKLFQQYGEDEIRFADDGAVIYSLMEISGEDTLKINFAASAEAEVTVRGTYLYRLSKEKAYSLQYTRETG